MANAIPKSLRGFALYVDGVGHAGTIMELELPTLEITGEEHRSGGMDVPIEMDMGMELLEATFTMAEYNPQMMNLFGKPGVDLFPITVKGGLSQESGTVTTPVVVNMQGRWRKIEPGTWKSGDKTEPKYEAVLSYYKYTQDGQVVWEIDAVNMIRVVNGVDQMASMRTALGF